MARVARPLCSDILLGLDEQPVDNLSQCLFPRVPRQAAQAVEIELAIRAGPLPDDRQCVAQFRLATQRARIACEFVDELGRVVVDVRPTAADVMLLRKAKAP